MPRSGSTLFSAILNQNPRFDAEPTTMLYELFVDLFYKVNKSKHGLLINNEKRINLLMGLFDSYYKDIDREIIFNTNRAWMSLRNVIPSIDKNMKIVCFVREVPLILNSFEKAFLKHPLYLSLIYDLESSIHNLASERCAHIFKEKLIPPLKIIEEMRSEKGENIMFIEYEHLCDDPIKVMKNFYEFIEEPHFEHDFSNVGASFEMLDLIDNNPGLHKTDNIVRKERTEIVVAPEILNKYNLGKYWLK